MNPKKVRNVRVHVAIVFFFWLLIYTIFVLNAVHVVVQRCVRFVLSGLRRNGAVFLRPMNSALRARLCLIHLVDDQSVSLPL